MVSGLHGATYEKLEELDMTTLEERRHRADMLQVFKILMGKDNVDRDSWFRMAAAGFFFNAKNTHLLRID